MKYKILIADDKGESFDYLQDILKDDRDRFQIKKTSKNEVYKSAVS